MSFIGIISTTKDFKNIRKNISKISEFKNLTLLEINDQNIVNIKNIVFETIIICSNFNFSNINNQYFSKICKNAKYLILNYDFNLPFLLNTKSNIITFGLNQKSTVTISSNTDEQIVLSLQRNIVNIYNKIKEVEEKSILLKSNTKNNNDIYIILITYILNIIYLKQIRTFLISFL